MSTEKKMIKTMVMHFHCGGATCDELLRVDYESESMVALDRGTNEPWFFDKKTGRCTNDTATTGCYRTITPLQWIITPEDRELNKELKQAKADLKKSLGTIQGKKEENHDTDQGNDN